MVAALLDGARPISLAGGRLTIAFPQEAAFMKRKAEQEDHRRLTAEALKNVTGQALALRYELRESDGGDAPGVLSEEELIRRFQEEFDAEELLDEQTDERDREAK